MPDEKLSDKQQLVYDYIKQYVKQNGYPPTVREVAEVLVCKSASTAQFHMQKLEEMGYIVRDPAKPRAYEFKESNNKTIDIPVLGTVAAGLPLYAEQNIREYFPISAEVARGNDFFMLKVKGDSMIKVVVINGQTVQVETIGDVQVVDITDRLDDCDYSNGELINGEIGYTAPENEISLARLVESFKFDINDKTSTSCEYYAFPNWTVTTQALLNNHETGATYT